MEELHLLLCICLFLILLIIIFCNAENGYLAFFIFALMVGIFDTIGDLMESVIKRYYIVKDSSKILPGHGGMLDRIDGLLIATPMWYLLLAIIGV